MASTKGKRPREKGATREDSEREGPGAVLGKGKGARDLVCRHIGARLRRRRLLLGLSQAQLGTALGLAFQQVQKYEAGASQLSPLRLVQLARLLGTSVDYFFAGLPGMDALPESERLEPKEEDGQALTLVRHFLQIEDGERRRSFLQLALTVSESDVVFLEEEGDC